LGWRVGCNPPSVLCGIRLIGLPALSGRILISAVCPFHVQDGRFTVSAQHPRQLSMPHWHLLGGRFVSAPLPGLSPYALAGVALLHVGGVSSGLIWVGPKATRQLASPKCFMANVYNKRFGRRCLADANG